MNERTGKVEGWKVGRKIRIKDKG